MEPELKISADGTKLWVLNGQLHRADGPAIEGTNGDKEWFINGKVHRADGPAVEFANGTRYWFLNDKKYSFANWCKQLNKSDAEITLLILKYGC